MPLTYYEAIEKLWIIHEYVKIYVCMNFLFDIVFPQFVLVYKFVQYYILEIGVRVCGKNSSIPPTRIRSTEARGVKH